MTLTCRELADFILDYLSGELPPEVLSAFEQHLGVCPNCVEYLEQYRTTIGLGSAAFSDLEAPVTDAPEDLIQAILAARKKSP